jgi:hypothetical protein
MIVLVGILTLEKFDRKEYQKGIIPYIFVCSFIALFMVADTLRFLEFRLPYIVLWINPILTIIIISIILWNSYNIGKCVNKRISVSIFIFGIGISLFESLKNIYVSLNYWLFGSICTFIATILLYFVIINFLIKRRIGCDND